MGNDNFDIIIKVALEKYEPDIEKLIGCFWGYHDSSLTKILDIVHFTYRRVTMLIIYIFQVSPFTLSEINLYSVFSMMYMGLGLHQEHGIILILFRMESGKG